MFGMQLQSSLKWTEDVLLSEMKNLMVWYKMFHIRCDPNLLHQYICNYMKLLNIQISSLDNGLH